jgi:uncharacterized membrane-anchored protein YjiN (DUF445 family)
MKIMRSEIDKLILEEYEDYEFLTEVNTPIREATMRIEKTRVKEIIQEELDRASEEQAPVWSKEEGFANRKPNRSRDRFSSDLDWRWNIFTQDYLYAASGFDDGLLRVAQSIGEYFREDSLTRDKARELAVSDIASLKNKYFSSPKIAALGKEGSEQVQQFDAEFEWVQQRLMDIAASPY